MPNSNLCEIISPKAAARFWAKVEKSDNCWVWKGSCDGGGYGTFSLYGRGKAPAKSHRISWAISNGRMPLQGMVICHQCDNPSCVNPDHLFEGTQKENAHDAMRKRRLSIPSKGRSGEANNSAKLTADEVSAIRARAEAGDSFTKIGREFGIHRTSASNIAKHKNWK